MFRLSIRALAILLLPLLPAAALAGPERVACEWPHPWNSTIPSCITLVGLAGGVVDPSGTFSVTVRDCIDGLPHSYVTVDFSQCADSHVGSQSNQVAGEAVNSADRTVSLYTDNDGVAVLDITGSANPAYIGPVPGARCARIYADGILLGSTTVRVLDLDGVAGVGLSDLVQVISDFYRGTYVGRSDYDCSGALGLGDLSVWAATFYSARSIQSPGAYAW
jgi:hypothetical protein